MNKNVISLMGIKKSYGNHRVLKGIELQIKEGTIMGLIGKNGTGKTTLIKCLLGLIKADSGESSIFGRSSWNIDAATKHRLGYVPQVITGFSWMSVGNMLDYTGSFYDNWNRKKIIELLGEWDLDINAKVGSLSTGERQKLAIIQTMGHDPELLILDEPVASLDPIARRKFIKNIINMNINENKTVLFSTHITSDLERLAAEIALLKKGRINYVGDLSTLKERIVRLNIKAEKNLFDPMPLSGIISSRIEKTSAMLTVDGIKNQEIKKIEQDFSARIKVEYLNLEDIFLELNR